RRDRSGSALRGRRGYGQGAEVFGLRSEFLAPYGHILWGRKAKMDPVPVDRQDRQPDAVTDDNLLTFLATEHQHDSLSFPGGFDPPVLPAPGRPGPQLVERVEDFVEGKRLAEDADGPHLEQPLLRVWRRVAGHEATADGRADAPEGGQGARAVEPRH